MNASHRQVGERVIVRDNMNCYDTIGQQWPHIARCPNFEMEALPENGKEYQITFIDEDCYRLVLDNTFIVNEEAFKERPYQPSWAEYMCYAYE